MFFDHTFTQMPWEQIDSVVFDIGNVLVEFAPEYMMEALFPGNPEMQKDMDTFVFSSPYWAALDRGTLSRQEAILLMTKDRRDLLEPVQLFFDRWVSMKRGVDEGLKTAQKCRDMGKKIYLLSNYHKQTFEDLREKFPFLKTFDGGVISYTDHLLKPEDAIYQCLLTRYNLTPARTVFIDDTQKNCEAAQKNGINAIWYHEKGQLARFFGIKEE